MVGTKDQTEQLRQQFWGQFHIGGHLSQLSVKLYEFLEMVFDEKMCQRPRLRISVEHAAARRRVVENLVPDDKVDVGMHTVVFGEGLIKNEAFGADGAD